MKLVRVTDIGDDRLEIVGVDDDGQEVVVHGWSSALTNHYGPEMYRDDGHRHPDAQPRAMTDAEALAYWHRLLEERAPGRPRVLYENSS